jgi:hypothetical protein
MAGADRASVDAAEAGIAGGGVSATEDSDPFFGKLPHPAMNKAATGMTQPCVLRIPVLKQFARDLKPFLAIFSSLEKARCLTRRKRARICAYFQDIGTFQVDLSLGS